MAQTGALIVEWWFRFVSLIRSSFHGTLCSLGLGEPSRTPSCDFFPFHYARLSSPSVTLRSFFLDSPFCARWSSVKTRVFDGWNRSFMLVTDLDV